MKRFFISLILQYFLGAFFIFSALLKINDPLGLQYKIDEYFDVFQLLALKDFSFLFAIVMNMVEFVIGVALLMDVYVRWMKWLMLLLLGFFTFLTAFAYFSGSLKECGCLGNCLPITAGVSFVKDIMLIILAILYAFLPDKISPISKSQKISFWLWVVFSYLAQVYVYALMPVWDCMPFKIGTHIPQGIEKYNQQAAKMQMFFVYQKNGEEVRFDADHFPVDFDSTYTYVRREDVPLGEKNREAIADFMFFDLKNRLDVSQTILQTDSLKLILVLNELAWSRLDEQMQKSKHLVLDNKNIFIASYDEKKLKDFFTLHQLPVSQALIMDNVLLKTMGRSPLTVFTIHQGTIVDKTATLFYCTVY